LIISESFNYAGPTLSDSDGAGTDANGGTGFSSAWNNSRTDAITTGLTDSRSASPGGGVGGAVTVSVNTTGRVFDGSTYDDADGQIIWFSMLIDTAGTTFNGTGNSRLMLFSSGPGMASGNGFGFELTTTNGSGTGNLVARLAATNGGTAATYTQGQANFVLGRFVYSAASNDQLQVWINPTAGQLTTFSTSGLLADLGTNTSTVSATTANITFTTTSGVYLRSGGTATSNWTGDELRVGTSFLDVVAAVPEPSAAAALAGLGALGVAVLRRRRA
jgi:hypothetical protein